MESSVFDAIAKAFEAGGSKGALDILAVELRRAGEFHRLFEARTMQARYEFGLPLLSSSLSEGLDESVKVGLEERMIDACREVGQALLQQGDIPGAYQYFHMIGELEPVRTALEETSPSPEDAPAFVEIALSRAVHPGRGIEIVLQHYGLCQAITACESMLNQGIPPDVRTPCIKRIVRALHDELVVRIKSDIEQREGTPPEGDIESMIAEREWLFADDNYHVDTSHLNAVVRMARLLPRCEEISLARELCQYGKRLSSKYRYPDPEPFSDVYADSQRFFEALIGNGSDEALEYFREKAESLDPREVGTYPSEVYLHLLREAGNLEQAIAYAHSHLADQPGPLTSTVNALCQEADAFEAMAEFARKRQDPVSFVAALISGGSSARRRS